jgi:hypothetical protein
MLFILRALNGNIRLLPTVFPIKTSVCPASSVSVTENRLIRCPNAIGSCNKIAFTKRACLGFQRILGFVSDC